jgi:hypothetical protein
VLHKDDDTARSTRDRPVAAADAAGRALADAAAALERYPTLQRPGSGLYRSDDGGRHVEAGRRRIPDRRLGRIGVAFAPSDPRRVYALVDAKPGGLWVSETAADLERVEPRPAHLGARLVLRRVTVDPKTRTRLRLRRPLYRSTDGGKTFIPFKGAPGGDDYHELRIDPSDPLRMILGSDQGAVVTVDGGRTWSSWYNQPTAQLYHVAPTIAFPYWIYGAQQDSGAAATPSRTDYASITSRDWKPVAVGGENGYVAPDPRTADDRLRRRRHALRLDDAAGPGRRSDASRIPGDYRGSGRCR